MCNRVDYSMAYEPNPGIGNLFSNGRKRPESKDPDYKGKLCLPDGTQMELVGWKKRSASGVTFLSLKLSEVREEGPQR